jgi:hypothetical protein
VYVFAFQNGRLENIDRRDRDTIPKDALIFAGVFQFFYLRLAIFFGCVGVFTNLFRGEMLDKSLHFYLLTPVRREVLAVGKYLAGLVATVVIFCTSTFLQLAALSLHFEGNEISEYLSGGGWDMWRPYWRDRGGLRRIWRYISGGRTPVQESDHSAAVVLVWENLNLFLPAALKRSA